MLSYTFATLAVALTSLVGSASADFSAHGLKILVPGGDNLWWLQGQPNNLIWTCGEADSTAAQFTVWINNTNVALETAITPLIAVEQNFNCAQGIGANLQTQPVGTGYTIVLTNINNASDIFAVSDPFEIKPLASGYPLAAATPTDTGSATVSKGTASNSIGAPTSSGSSSANAPAKTGAASRVQVGSAAALAAFGAIAAFVL
ncbi:hypothetical protein FB45DRAFT_924505 [Roridomyces roridus]|uniref:Uncharacterized protein n=1 Tax=Roridomyces roridus TaxID=1738132 RepID=A0AAD7FHV0_9AGAR|nr:hypothetical protein FB45DRAFT_924505 [Roridomyces roridus]